MAFGFISDIFSQQDAQGYKPNKANFEWGTTGAGGQQYLNSQELYKNGPKGPQADLTNANESRGLGLQSRAQLQSALGELGSRRADPTLSQAYQQLQQGQSENERRALALARSSGGGGAGQAAALRNAQFQNAQGAQQTNQAAGIQRAGEVAAIDQQMIAGLAQQRSMDLQAQGLDAQTAMQQAQLELGQRGLNMQGALGFGQLGQAAADSALRGSMGYEGLMAGGQNAASLANAQFDAQRDAGLAGLLGTIGAGALLASDIRSKADITPMGGPPSQQDANDAYRRAFQSTYGAQPSGFNAEDSAAANRVLRRNWGAEAPMVGVRGAGGMDSPSMAPPQALPDNGLGSATAAGTNAGVAASTPGFAQKIAPMISDQLNANASAAGGSSMVNPQSMWMSPEAVIQMSDERSKYVMSDEQSKEKIASLTAMNKYLANEMKSFAFSQPKPRPTADMLPSQNKEYADAFARHEAARREAMRDMMGQAEDDDRRERLVRGESPDVITERPKIGEVARGYSYPLTAGEQGALELNALKSAGVLRPEEAGVGPGAPVHAVASDKRAKDDMRELGRMEGEALASVRALRGAPTYPTVRQPGEASVGRMPDVSSLNFRPGGSMVRPDVRQPDTAALDEAHNRELTNQTAAIPAYQFRYKEPYASQYGAEPRIGTMAQDLEQIPATAPAVKTGPDGMKRVDAGQLTMTNTAMLGDLARYAEENDRRLKRLEATRGRVSYPKVGGAR